MIREGRQYEVLASNLVIGDVIHVNAGDQVPADMRLIYGAGFKVRYRAVY